MEIHVYMFSLFFLLSNVSGEISSTPELERDLRYDSGIIIVPCQEYSSVLAHVITPLNGGILEVYVVNVSTHVWHTIFKGPLKLRTSSHL
ncbi:hypothetical protein MTR_6g059640 [Medicago truncatula]|uniref:Transmembrane protein n=1 Tax=Medicago truncatula TaxID=3880 RepID=G7KMI5_MEDTR|nr:hypothetical protein MTR_6g059640 [Medicago truncatula]